MKLLSKIIVLSGFLTASLFFTANVSATTCSFGATLGATDFADLTTSTACEVHGGINDTTANIASLDPFGITDWVLADKSDGPDGDHAITLSGVVNGVNSGTWSVNSFAGYTSVFLTLKAGNNFAAYLLDTAFLNGAWATANIFPSGGGGKGLSHMSLYYSPTSLTVVPLPAALPLYGAGLLILGFMGYKRRKS
jgi:hypothetical protein